MTEKHQEILRIIEDIRLSFPIGDEKAIDEAFQRLFEKEAEYFGGICRSVDDVKVGFEMLNVIADNHIRRHNILDLGIKMHEWIDAFKDFDDKSPFTEEEKKPVKESFHKLLVKVREFLKREAKGEEALREEQGKRNAKNVRPENSLCCLCKRNRADEVGSHAVPHFLLQKILNHNGRKGRDYENVERFTLAEDEKFDYLGTNILPEERADILNHELSQEEIDSMANDHNPLTFDHFFCKDCEKRLGVIESQYSQIINGKKSAYKWSIPYLFWMSVVWRMSVTKMGMILPPNHQEKYRKVLDLALSLDKDKICDDPRKLGHCAYTIFEVEDTKEEGIGVFGFPIRTTPAGCIIGKQILVFFHSLDKAQKMTVKAGKPLDCINDGTKKEVIGKCSFIEFWRAKRSILDADWQYNFFNRGMGENVLQFMSKINFEKEHLDVTGSFATFDGVRKDMEGYHLTYPRSILRIKMLMDKGAKLDEIIDKTGYTKEEIEEMMSYWLARAEAEIDSQE